MDDLVRQILAAIEATEQDARDASARSAVWSVADHVAPPWGENPPDDAILADGKPIARMNTEHDGCLAASHIARHDPASALRRCAADRRRLERHTPIPDHGRFSDDWANECPNPGDCDHDERPKVCGTCRDQVGDPIQAPCPDLLDLVDAYDIHTNPEPGSPMAEDLAEASAGDTVGAEVIAADLAERAAATATVHQEEGWFIAQATAPDIASQGRTEEEARANLREAVELYLTNRHNP